MIGKVLPDHKILAELGTGQLRIANIPEKIKQVLNKLLTGFEQVINRF